MDFLHWLSVIGLSMFKVIPGLGLAIAYDMHPSAIFGALTIGGMLGVILFSTFAVRIRKWRKKRRIRTAQEVKLLLANAQVDAYDPAKMVPSVPKMSWSQRRVLKPHNIRRARRIKRLWSKFGIIGIALITPPIISPPVGAMIAVFFGERLRRIYLFMFLSVLLWAAIFALLGHQILELLYDDPTATHLL